MELWDAYNEAEEKLGFDLVRGEKIPEGAYHLVCEVVVQSPDGDFLLMQRSWEKEVSPGKWEIGAGGSAMKGETPLEGACRELREETGIEAAGALQELYRAIHREHHAIYHGYLLVTDWPRDGIVLQEGETIAYRWISGAEFLDFYDNGSIGSQKERLREYVDSIREEIRLELNQTQAKLEQAEVQLSQTQAELAVALEELERYRAAEREKEINKV